MELLKVYPTGGKLEFFKPVAGNLGPHHVLFLKLTDKSKSIFEKLGDAYGINEVERVADNLNDYPKFQIPPEVSSDFNSTMSHIDGLYEKKTWEYIYETFWAGQKVHSTICPGKVSAEIALIFAEHIESMQFTKISFKEEGF